MPEPRELQSVLDAAEQAAAAGDYTAAEQFLREAALQQEARLGPFHPDLANTFNNLGIVCESLDKPADAERCFRRAYAIATAALEPDHPFVATSQKNLRDFCDARGIPFELPDPPPAVAPPVIVAPEAVPAPPVVTPPVANVPVVPPPVVAPPVVPPRAVVSPAVVPTPAPLKVPSAAPRREQPAVASEPQRVTVVKRSPSRAIGVVGVGALLLLALIAGRLWFRGNENVDPSQNVATPSASSITLSPPSSTASAPSTTPPPLDRSVAIAEPPPVKPTPVTPATESDRDRPVKADVRRPTAKSASGQPTVVEAHLCNALSTGAWRCDPASRPVRAGRLFFYTRVTSSTNTTIQHRWYRGDRLHQDVELRIQANQGGGYRTYSRTTVEGGSASDWRVEIRTMDGALLYEERFAVR